MSVLVQNISRLGLVSAAALFASLASAPAQAQSAGTTFFVTSFGPGTLTGFKVITDEVVPTRQG